MAAGNKIPKITDFDTLQAYVDATLAADGPPKSMGKAGPGKIPGKILRDKIGPGKAGPGKAGPGNIVPGKIVRGKTGSSITKTPQKMRKTPQRGQNNG